MARLTVRVDDFEDGAFPRVCVSSGDPADRPYELTASYKPSWPVVFLLLGPIGWVIMLVAALGTERKVTGTLPMSDVRHARMCQARRTQRRHALEVVGLTIALAAVLTVLDLGTATIVVVAIGIVATGAFWTASAAPKGSVGIKLSRNGRTVELTDVADAFADRYREQEARRRAEREREAARATGPGPGIG
jgi:hypothetical protein